MIRAIYRWIIRVVEVISIIGCGLMVLFTAYEITMREGLNRPTIWTNEVTTCVLVWVGLLAVVYAYDRGSHVSVDLIFRRFRWRTQCFLNIVTSVLTLMFAVIVGVFGYQYWWFAFSRGWRHTGTLDIPMTYTRIMLPIVGLLLTFQLIMTIYDHIGLFRSMAKSGGEVEEKARDVKVN